MGLALPAMRYIVKENKRKAFQGPVLTLGRQYVFATYEDVVSMIRKEGVEPLEIPSKMSLKTNIPNWQNHPVRKHYTSDVVFFKLLGLDLFSLDITDYEGSEYSHDLNMPISDDLKNKFMLILDGGTMEHVFNTKQFLENIGLMLQIGGRIMHQNPASNYSAHGFYQFSPCFYFDYYDANSFTDFQCHYIVQPLKKTLAKIYGRPSTHSWDMYRINEGQFGGLMISDCTAMVFFTAQKTEVSTYGKIPIQGSYKFVIGDKPAVPENQKTQKNRIEAIKAAVEKKAPKMIYVLVKFLFTPFLRRFRRSRKIRKLFSPPWGGSYEGKI
jgi:hypothetical protein